VRLVGVRRCTDLVGERRSKGLGGGGRRSGRDDAYVDEAVRHEPARDVGPRWGSNADLMPLVVRLVADCDREDEPTGINGGEVCWESMACKLLGLLVRPGEGDIGHL